MLWTTKYAPKNTNEIRGQDQAINTLKDYCLNYKTQKKKAAILYGPTGSGKTSMAHALAKELGYEILEINASDFRNKAGIEANIGPALLQSSLFFPKGKIILIDEIDGLSGSKDRGGISALTKLMTKSRFPIIMTANDPFDKKFSSLRKKAELLPLRTLAYTSIRAHLKEIAIKENIDFDDITLTTLARRAGGDLRGAIIDLQVLSTASKTLQKEDIDNLSDRKQIDTMINALMIIFKTMDPNTARSALNNVDEDADKIALWIDENLPKEYRKAEDLSHAYDCLSLSNVYSKRIRRWQYWRYLVYIYDLLSAGIALSKSERYKGFNKYIPSSRILNIWIAKNKNAKKEQIAEKIAKKTHTSKYRVKKDTLPYIQVIFKKNKQKSDSLAEYFDLEKEEIEWLLSH